MGLWLKLCIDTWKKKKITILDTFQNNYVHILQSLLTFRNEKNMVFYIEYTRSIL